MTIERSLENTIYAARWLLAPIYLGLSLALFALGIKFFQEIIHVLPIILDAKEKELVLVLLAMIDLTMVGALIVMAMFSGYENFVSRLDIDADSHKLDWPGKLDAGSLKLKIAASIVAISSIHLLRAFMNAPQIPGNTLMWYVIIHMTFVISAVAMGYLDKMTKH